MDRHFKRHFPSPEENADNEDYVNYIHLHRQTVPNLALYPAVEVLGESRAELELGRAFSAYAEYEERTGRAATADDLRERAQAIRTRAIHGEAAASAAEL